MKDKRGRGLKIVISLLVLVALIHGTTHIVLFGTNLSLTQTIGVSGFAIGETNVENIETSIKQNEKIPLPSILVIIAEWVLVFSLLALSSIKKRLAESVQKATHIELVKKKNKSDTDIDLLYEMLKKNKRISLSKLAELFKVDKKVVEEWGKILEENGYVEVDYPRFGEIEMRIKEDEETQKA
ncbi:MAG: hypothetical protein ACP5N7_04440 [Candidatus Pacearchaeota archaeon]